MMVGKQVSWSPQASLSTELGWYSTSAQWKTFSADKDDDFVWEQIGLTLAGFRS